LFSSQITAILQIARIIHPKLMNTINTNNEELIKKADIQKIAEEGAKIYESIRLQYEPTQNGKFLAIDIDSKDKYIGNTSSEAVELARNAHPNKVFYVVKIGFSAAETLASLGLNTL
jgi:hypothetical protein